MRTLMSLLALLLLAAPAHALGGKVRVLGDAVTLEGRSGATKLLLADDARGHEILAQLRQFPGLQASVEGRDTPSGFVVTKLRSPFREEADVLVTARPGHPEQVVVRMGSSPAMTVVGPKAALLAQFVNHEVRLRAWFFMDSYDALPDTVAPVAVRHTPDVGDSAWIGGVDGAQAQGKNPEGEPVTLPLADVRVGPVRGRAGRVSGTLSAGDTWTLTDAAGRVFDVGGGEGVVPENLRAFDGRDGVEVEGTIVDGDDPARPTIMVERVVSPVVVRLTGQVAGETLRAGGRSRALFGRESEGLARLLTASDGQQVTLEGLVSPTAVFVQRVAGRVTGPLLIPDDGFKTPADGQVWIIRGGHEGAEQMIVKADGQPGCALIAPANVSVVARPTQGIAGSLGR